MVNREIKCMEAKYLNTSLDMVKKVFSDYDSVDEANIVCRLVKEIRSKQYYIPKLELIMVDQNDEVIGYSMFSRFNLEGNYEDELLILTPVAVKTELQRQHISKELIEFGFEKAKSMGYKAVIVEGNPKNYNSRGFVTSFDYGIKAGENVKLPNVNCLMVKELEKGSLLKMKGIVDYSFYDALTD